MAERGYDVAPAFRAVHALWRRDGEAVALLSRPELPRRAACLLPLLAAVPTAGGPAARVAYHPVAYARTRFFADLTDSVWVHATFTETTDGSDDVCPGRCRRLHAGRATPRRVPRHRAPAAASGDPAELMLRLVRDAVTAPKSLLSRLPSLSPGPSRSLLPSFVSFLSLSSVRTLLSVPTPALEAGAGTGDAPTVLRPDPAPAPAPSVEAPRPVATAVPDLWPVPDTQSLIRHAARLLGMSPNRIDERRPLRDYGLDSLMALQLERRLRSEHGLVIPVSRLVGAESPAQLARQ
jgi:aryl carrier-like protein